MRNANIGFSDNGVHSGADLLELIGPIVRVQIGFDPLFRPGSGLVPNLPNQLHLGLVDTGASTSSVDSALAVTLGLPVIDQENHSGANGAFDVNIHAAQIHIPSLNWTITGRFAGVHLAAGGQRYKALIGRTFLRDYTMIYEGSTGQVTLSRNV